MLAIVIPYYKRTFFEETLQSLAAQTDKRFYVYIGDDAAPESCEDLLEKYKGTFACTFKRFESNLGGISLVKQWERCIDMVQEEEWLMILGDDDVLGTNVVEEFYNNYEKIKNKTNVIRFSVDIIDGNSQSFGKEFTHPIWENVIESFNRKFLKLTHSSLSEQIFRKKTVLKYGFKNYPLAWNSDRRLIIDVSEKLPIFSINTAIIKVRKSSENISNNTSERVLIKKKKATLYFYIDLLYNKGFLFNKNQRFQFFRKIRSLVRIMSMNDLSYWLKLIVIIFRFKFFY